MKNKDFELAVNTLQTLFASLSDRGVLTDMEIVQFNSSQKSIIAYYNFMSGTGAVTIKYPWNDEYFIAVWEKWRSYKKQQFNFRYKTIAEQSALRDLFEISKGDKAEAIRIIEKAISRGWMGLFPDKVKANPKPKTSTVYKQSIVNRLSNQQ